MSVVESLTVVYIESVPYVSESTGVKEPVIESWEYTAVTVSCSLIFVAEPRWMYTGVITR
ncbi:hypothetical protein GF326_00200 [Candidatus Bathyarchaeota archaeon]|nr:hypothetical protein [Candidatus Bathyarchaeota archaeon]